jgi:hypothetical protein
MRKHPKSRGVVPVAILVTALFLLVLAGTAQAKLTGEFTKFQNCPYTNEEVRRCLYSVTNGGEVLLGTKKVPIEKEVILQGGYGKPNFEEENPEFLVAKFFAATNGITLSKAAQNVPGGLLGIVPEEKSPALVKALIKFFFENKITGVTSTLELAKPASDIRISENHLAEGEGVALKLPVKVHLENPFLGKNCYVGSSTSPITLQLTSGVTSPPKGTTPITGKVGEVEFLEEARILRLNGNELADNAWSAPAASGCGGIISFLVTPIINGQIGLPSAAGKNTAILKNTVMTTTADALITNNAEHP